MPHYYASPSRRTNSDEETRRVGFELEFAGLELQQTANILAQAIGSQAQFITEAEYKVESRWGDFMIELDWQFAKTTAQERAEVMPDNGPNNDKAMAWLTKVASQVVPVEIVCPPISIDALNSLDGAVNNLRQAGAKGTSESLLYAFGVHINPELPQLDSATIVDYLQAFVLCEAWLVGKLNVDYTRRLSPYINNYPKDYHQLVLSYESAPELAQLIDDYIQHNPTRNRALDMLPLFKYLDEERISPALPDPKINARPTFHYRMPNCEIEQPGWSLHQSWNAWCVVEALANDRRLISSLRQEWLTEQQKTIPSLTPSWHSKLDEIWNDLVSA